MHGRAARLMGERVPDGFFAGANVLALLGRPPRSIPVGEGERQLRGARVLVTGAGGSIGTALVSRLLALDPELVVALDNHEASLFRLGRALGSQAPLELRLADVRHADKIKRIFRETRPSVVFHLAAYKHVPFGEREPDEPVSVNVLGSQAVATAAVAAGASHVVYSSSDKAVNPPSVYGATKRLAETILLAHSATQSTTSFHAIRYVNVLGSSGSALETFVEQAQAGAPLTLTDRRMTRYWMAMDEAIDLLWHALGLPSGSRTLLEPGDPIPVEAMARRIYRLIRGDSQSPNFVITGARPGERLTEELTSESESLVRCGEDPVLRVVHSRFADHAALAQGMVDELAQLLAAGAVEQLRARVMDLARLLQ